MQRLLNENEYEYGTELILLCHVLVFFGNRQLYFMATPVVSLTYTTSFYGSFEKAHKNISWQDRTMYTSRLISFLLTEQAVKCRV